MDDIGLFDAPEPPKTSEAPPTWTTVSRAQVTYIVEDVFTGTKAIKRVGQRSFFPRHATYRWVWKPTTGWYLDLCEVSGPNQKADGSVGQMNAFERLHGFHPERWARLPDWLFRAMVASRPNWEPAAAELEPAEGAAEAFLKAAQDANERERGAGR